MTHRLAFPGVPLREGVSDWVAGGREGTEVWVGERGVFFSITQCVPRTEEGFRTCTTTTTPLPLKKESHLLASIHLCCFVVTVNGYWPLCYHPCHTWRDGDGSSSSCDVFCAVGEAPSGWLFVPGTQTHVLRCLLFLLLCPCSTAWCLLPLHDVRTTKMSRGTSWHS